MKAATERVHGFRARGFAWMLADLELLGFQARWGHKMSKGRSQDSTEQRAGCII